MGLKSDYCEYLLQIATILGNVFAERLYRA
jgi:hypothetical protein